MDKCSTWGVQPQKEKKVDACVCVWGGDSRGWGTQSRKESKEALGSRVQQNDTGRWKESSVSMDVGVEKWSGHEDYDTANHKCRGHELGSLP